MPFLIFILWLFSACNYVDYFREGISSKSVTTAAIAKTQTYGRSLGRKAGGMEETALAEVYDKLSDIAPAAIRWDPDLYPRLLLRQYREEGIAVARNISNLEGFRLLLGGATANFSTTIRPEFDATALLATMKVGDTICYALIDPNPNEHGDWSTILPSEPSDWRSNLRFLAQRFSGRPSSEIGSDRIEALKEILDAYTPDHNYSLSSYVPVCTALNIDPEWVWL